MRRRVVSRAVLAFFAWVLVLFVAGLVRRAERTLPASAFVIAPAAAAEEGAPVIALDFDRPPPQGVLSRGWSEPEPGTGVWSVGQVSVIDLPAINRSGVHTLKVTLQPFVGPRLPAQRVRVSAGGHTLAERTLTAPDYQTLEIRLPEEVAASTTPLQLQFDLPDAKAPAIMTPGSTDTRVLAVRLRRIELSR